MHIVKGKKNKFTHISKKKKKSSKIQLCNKINTLSKNNGHGGRTEYWDPGKINEPKNGKNNLTS